MKRPSPSDDAGDSDEGILEGATRKGHWEKKHTAGKQEGKRYP